MAYSLPDLPVTGAIIPAAWGVKVRDSIAASAVGIVTTAGDLPYATGLNALSRLPIGSTGKVLTVVGGLPAWASPTTSALTTRGDLLTMDATPALTRLAIGAANRVLTSSGTDPQWSAQLPNAALNLTTAGDLLYASSSTVLARIAIGATGSVLTSDGSTPSWSTTPTVAGLITASGGVLINGGSFAAGRIYKSATAGLVLAAITGSGDDFLLATPGGGTIFEVPTGTSDIKMAGHVLFGTDNAKDIGASAATRPRSIYWATALIAPGTVAATGDIRLAQASVAKAVINGTDRTVLMFDVQGPTLGDTARSGFRALVGGDTGGQVYAGGAVVLVANATTLSPNADNVRSLGASTSDRWSVVYAANGTIQTSHSSQKNLLGEIPRGEALRRTRALTFHRFTMKGDHEDDFLKNYVHLGVKAEDAGDWISPDGHHVNAQCTATQALAAVVDEADAREADVAALRAEIERLESLIKKRSN